MKEEAERRGVDFPWWYFLLFPSVGLFAGTIVGFLAVWVFYSEPDVLQLIRVFMVSLLVSFLTSGAFLALRRLKD